MQKKNKENSTQAECSWALSSAIFLVIVDYVKVQKIIQQLSGLGPSSEEFGRKSSDIIEL